MARIPAHGLFLALGLLGQWEVNGQDLVGEPSCATGCIKTAVPGAGCNIGDAQCMCGSQVGAIFALLGPCLVLNCKPADIGSMSSIAFAQCSSANAGLLTTLTPTGTVAKAQATNTGAAPAVAVTSATSSAIIRSTFTDSPPLETVPASSSVTASLLPTSSTNKFSPTSTASSATETAKTTSFPTNTSPAVSGSSTATNKQTDGVIGIDGGNDKDASTVGIAVGLVAGVFAFGALGLVLAIKRSSWGKALLQARRQPLDSEPREWPEVEKRMTRYPSIHVNSMETPVELDAPMPVFELPGTVHAYELP